MPITDSIKAISPASRGRIAALRRHGRSLIDQGLWLIVATVFMCAALAVGLNTDINASDNLSSAKAANMSAQEGGRIYNEAGMAACVIGLLIAISRPKALKNGLRVLRSPIVWVLVYQAIIAWHYWVDENAWDMARLCGVSLLLMVALAASPPMAPDRYVAKMLLLFRILMWMSLAVGIVLPSNGWEHNFVDSFLPGVEDRFAGIGGHANGMGAIAGIAVLLELDCFFGSSSKRWLSFLHLGLGGVLLLLTQSKTSLLACALCGSYLLLSRKRGFLPGQVRVLMVAASVLIGSLVAYGFLADWVASNENSLGELTGRLSLWQYLWNVGLEQPWFGYERSLWSDLAVSESFQYKWAAGNAHNQLLNSFLMAGAVGVGCLIAYVAALIRKRRQIDIHYRALFTSCLMFMIIRSFAEAGFEPGDLWVVGHIQTMLIGFCLCSRAAKSHLARFAVARPLRRPEPEPAGVAALRA